MWQKAPFSKWSVSVACTRLGKKYSLNWEGHLEDILISQVSIIVKRV